GRVRALRQSPGPRVPRRSAAYRRAPLPQLGLAGLRPGRTGTAGPAAARRRRGRAGLSGPHPASRRCPKRVASVALVFPHGCTAMRMLVLLSALAMPLVAWFAQSGSFGPDNGEISDRYPTLLVAAGYAFSIWSLIFLLDLVHAVRQLRGPGREDPLLGRIAPATAAGFILTTAWMPL